MPIHTPGKVLLKNIPLRFVASKAGGHGGKSVNTEIPLVPFIDFLITLVVFLLMSFSASGELLAQKPSIELPKAANTTDLEVAPVIAIDAQVITLDGRQMAETPNLEGETPPERIEALITDLDTIKRNWAVLHPSEPFPGELVVQADEKISFRVIKKIMFNAGIAGFPTITFAVNKVEGK